MKEASWRNLHMLPHDILAYEMRVPEGYGMRWSQDRSSPKEGEDKEAALDRAWIFRGFIEPMIENGHEIGWRHVPASLARDSDNGSKDKDTNALLPGD
jgi:hypothetical protein